MDGRIKMKGRYEDIVYLTINVNKRVPHEPKREIDNNICDCIAWHIMRN